MRKLLLALTILLAASFCLAQQVYIVKEQPTGERIRLTVQDSTGKAVDGGEWIRVPVFDKVVKDRNVLVERLDSQLKANLALLYPAQAAMLSDTSYAIVKKSQLAPPPPKKKK